MNKRATVVVILGPTSTGKSDIAIKLAKKFNGEVVSADSRQVYRDMDLGTGKVVGSWKTTQGKKVFLSDGVVHHLLDFRSPKGEYNVSHFKKDCERILGQIVHKEKLPIICGGTGFWILSVVENIKLPKVTPNKKLRRMLSDKNTSQLFDMLKGLDPVRAKTIDRNNHIRLIRAIEIAKELGSVPKVSKRKDQKYEFLQIGIDWPQNILDQKIKKRLESRWTAGMAKEVEQLRKKHRLSWDKIQSFGLGYYWIPEYLKQNIDLEQLKENVFRAERRYAKRQRTWFKRDKKIVWENNYSKIKKIVGDFVKK